MPDLKKKVDALLKWCVENEVFLDRRIRLGIDGHGGIGVFSKEDHILPNTTLVKISKTSVLSARSCSLASDIPCAPYGLAAQLALALSVYVETLRGRKSRWHGYLQSFPSWMVDLPLFWNLQLEANAGTTAHQKDRTATAYLQGTEAGKINHNKLEPGNTLLEEITYFYYETAEPILLSRADVWRNGVNDCATPTLQGFYSAYSLVSSRAFLVDAYHGLAMVPIADAFNHVLENHVHLESDYDVCTECGFLFECPHDRDDQIMGDKHVPGFHDTTTDYTHNQFYEMVSNTGIPPDAEIFNTYGGDLNNAQLLTQYGFLLDVNDNDRLSWSLFEILDILAIPRPAPDSKIGPNSLDNITLDFHNVLAGVVQHRRFFNDSQLIYHEALGENVFCINADGTMSHQLWTILFTLSARRIISEGHLNDDALKKLPSVLELQNDLENMDETDDTEGRDERGTGGDGVSGGLRSAPYRSALQSGSEHSIRLLLLEICQLAVKLFNTRKENSGPSDGCDEDSLGDTIDMETCEDDFENRRTKLAISVLISERSILDAAEAGWIALIHSVQSTINGE